MLCLNLKTFVVKYGYSNNFKTISLTVHPSISRLKEQSWQVVVTFVSFAALMELHTSTFGALKHPRPQWPQKLNNFPDQL